MKKKLLSFLLAVLVLLSITACNEEATAPTKNSTETKDPYTALDAYIFKNDDSVELGTPDVTLDPQVIYSNLTYTPEMFHGDYSLVGGSDVEEAYGNEAEYFTWVKHGNTVEYSVLPYGIKAGKHSLSYRIKDVEEYDWMELFFRNRVNGKNYLDTVLCAYSIEGNKLVLHVLDTFSYDSETDTISYAFTDEVWEYTFSFCGRELTLSTGDSSVTMTAGLDAYCMEDYFHVGSYLSEGSERIAGIDKISFYYDSDDSYIYFETVDGMCSYNSIAMLEKDGRFTFTLALDETVKTYQFVYFYADYDGLILTDGTNVYYYTASFSDRSKTVLSGNLADDEVEKIDDISDSRLEVIVEKKENLMDDLAAAIRDAGIAVTVDAQTGELAIDATILFSGDSAVLTDEGKAFLNQFLDVYTSIIYSEKYEGFVSKTIIEGHTALLSDSTYESGLPLSEERANTVKDYCLSGLSGVDTSSFAEGLEAVGRSNSVPIWNADGTVDLAASRRVTFRFIINLDME